MKTLSYESKEEWLAARRGKITGSRLKDIIVKKGNGKKIGFYELIAEKIGIDPDADETPMDRGTRLEEQAIKRFEEETGTKVNTSLVIWQREDDENIAVSPDGFIDDEEALAVASTGTREAVECKCRSSARHIEAWLTQEVPDEYKDQVIQYFIVNERLETLYFVFYDDRIPSKEFFYLTIKRESVQDKVDEYLLYQKMIMEEVNTIVNELTF